MKNLFVTLLILVSSNTLAGYEIVCGPIKFKQSYYLKVEDQDFLVKAEEYEVEDSCKDLTITN